MQSKISLMVASMLLAACGQSPAPENAAATDTQNVDASVAAQPAGDPCTLVDDPETMFGKPVTASIATMPNETSACEWKSAEGRICGSVTVFGPGWNEVPDLAANYAAMARSVGAFGQTQPLEGVGQEAVAVDGGMLGAQVALRTDTAIANVAAACAGSGRPNFEQAEKLARAVAAKL